MAWARLGQEVLPELGRALVAMGHRDVVPEVVTVGQAVARLLSHIDRHP